MKRSLYRAYSKKLYAGQMNEYDQVTKNKTKQTNKKKKKKKKKDLGLSFGHQFQTCMIKFNHHTH